MNCKGVIEIMERTAEARRSDKAAGIEMRSLDVLTTVAERMAMRNHVQSCPDCHGVLVAIVQDRIKNGTFRADLYMEGAMQAVRDMQDPESH
jgi:uncharacterized protein with PIN domain